MVQPWYATFFDQRYVEGWTAAGAFEGTEEDATALVELLRLEDGATILDVPCGFGRFSGPLAAAGYAVTGVDLSADMIALAKQRNPGPTYVVADMRDPPHGPFDAVVCLYSSLGYFEDPEGDLEALCAWHRVLHPGGTLLIDTMHRDRLARGFGEPRPEAAHDDAPTETPVVDWVAGRVVSRVRFADGEERVFSIRVRTATELVGLAREAGFGPVEVFGDLYGGPFSPDSRLVIRATA